MSDPEPNPTPPSQDDFDKLLKGMLRTPGEQAAAGPPLAPPSVPDFMRVFAEIEYSSLELAAEEMRKEGMKPWLPGGQGLWFPLAAAISRHVRARLALTPDPPITT